MEEEEKKSKTSKIIITVSVIIIFVIMIGIILYFGIYTINKINENQQENTIENNKTNTTNMNTIEENITNEEIIDDQNEELDKTFGKIEIVWLDRQNNIISEPLAPVNKGLTPIKYVEGSGKFTVTNSDDIEWYNYEDKRWANAIDENKNYFVWIPRYAYKIVYYSDSHYTKRIGYCDSRGLLKINQDKKTLTRIKNNSTGLQEVGNHYIVAPAFMKDTASGFKNGGWDINISGMWVAKFEMSMELNGENVSTENESIGNVVVSDIVKAVSKPSKSSWRNLTVGKAYYNAFQFDRNRESHLVKNSEWGAIAYLAYSKYGRDTYRLDENKSLNYITGGSKIDTEVFIYNHDQSTTGNATGIYDISGCAWEFVAAFINNGYQRLEMYGGKEENYIYADTINSKYKTIYNNAKTDNGNKMYDKVYAYQNYDVNADKRGDAMFETSLNGYGSSSWNTNSSFYMQQDIPYLLRGGDFESRTSAGLFSYNGSNGSANAGEGFRVILICE